MDEMQPDMEQSPLSMGFEMSHDSNDSVSIVEDAMDNDSEKPAIGRKEAEGAMRWKMGVALMLLLTASTVIVSTYKFLTRAESDEFVASIFEGLSDGITLDSVNKQWPFVVVDDFEAKAAHARITSFTESVFFVPLVFGPFRSEWEEFSVKNTQWLNESRSFAGLTSDWLAKQGYHSEGSIGTNSSTCPSCSSARDADYRFVKDSTLTEGNAPITKDIFQIKDKDNCLDSPPCLLSRDDDRAIYGPVWQMSPPPENPNGINYNIVTDEALNRVVSLLLNSETRSIITGLFDVRFLYSGMWSDKDHSGFHGSVLDEFQDEGSLLELPHSVAVTSIYSRLLGTKNSRIVGFVAAVIPWDLYFSRLLPDGVNGVYVVLESSCDATSTYVINGPQATFLGKSDLHDPKYDFTRRTVPFNVFGSAPQSVKTYNGPERYRPCEYTLNLYASDLFLEDYETARTELFMVALAGVFIGTALVFFVYVTYVQRRQKKILDAAIRTNAVVSSLFPSNVRDRILSNAASSSDKTPGAKQRIKRFLNGDLDEENGEIKNTKPIADLFPETTIMICDMVGFTAWSSGREPSAVFELLEHVYGAFDEAAKRRRVFKVETVGDQYLAVAGLPTPMKDHAVVCCRFALDCALAMDRLAKSLSSTLGPDTEDLSMRFGVHSGPVTAGVLRGDRGRFQLFGDTVNTAARLESTGQPRKIQVSTDTAELLMAAGKEHWIQKRPGRITAKGKGELEVCRNFRMVHHLTLPQTYWLNVKKVDERKNSSDKSSVDSHQDYLDRNSVKQAQGGLTEQDMRLVGFNTDLILRLLRGILSTRPTGRSTGPAFVPTIVRNEGETIFDEIQDVIVHPGISLNRPSAFSKTKLSRELENEVHLFVRQLSMLYRSELQYHNLDHSSHTTLSVSKFFSRLDDAEAVASTDTVTKQVRVVLADPLTQLAMVFATLTMNVGHEGISNEQLKLEAPELGEAYNNRAIAEQHSIALVWELLMAPCFATLQQTIFPTRAEFLFFRRVMVNAVMATDFTDTKMSRVRTDRWSNTFRPTAGTSDLVSHERATLIMECMAQTASVSYCLQHWHIYKKWSTRLFEERYHAFLMYRSDSNPVDTWFQDQLVFFDTVVIPLAKRMAHCGVFDSSASEYLAFAERNRDELFGAGKQLVEEMVESINENLFQRHEI